MITVIHGEDIASSRNYFISEKEKYENSVIYDAKSLSEQGLLEILQAKNLFFDQKGIFIENLLLLKNKDFIELVKKAGTDSNIYIWEGKEISSTELLGLKAISKLFKLPQELFVFLDNIRPNNSQNVYFFRNALKNSPEDLIFYMLIRQFRLLLAVSGDAEIDEAKRLLPWQREKLERQAKLFSEKDLKRTYNKLYKIDHDIKTGEASSLTSSIDFLLLDI